MKKIQLLMAAFMCLACVSSCQSADNAKNANEGTENVEAESVEADDGNKLEYKVPDNLTLVTGVGEGKGAFIYKQPDLNSPKLLDVDMGEGSYTQWSDEKKTEPSSYYSNAVFSKYSITALLGTEGDFVKTQDGYVEKSKTVTLSLQPLALDDIKKDSRFQVINEGKFKDCVVYNRDGEGGITYYFGRVIDNVLVFCNSAYYYYDEGISGVNDEAYGKDRSYQPKDSYYEAVLDFNKLTGDELDKMLAAKHDQENIVVLKTNNQISEIYLDPAKVPTKTVKR